MDDKRIGAEASGAVAGAHREATAMAARARTDYRIGLAMVAASALAWSTAGLFTRWIALDASSLLVGRNLFAALGLVVAIAVLEPVGAPRRLGPAGRLFVVVSAVGMIAYVFALRTTSVAHVSLLYATAPLVAAGLGWVALGARPGRGAMLASLAALGGVGLMVGVGTDGAPLGDALAVVMTLSMAAMLVIARVAPGVPAMRAALWSALLSGAVAAPFAAAALDVALLDLRTLALLAAFGLLCAAVPLTLLLVGARRIAPVEAALLGAVEAPLAPIWVWFAFGEPVGAWTLAGGAIVMGAVVAHLATDRGAHRLRRADGEV